LGKYGVSVYPKSVSKSGMASVPPQIKYANNRSFLSGKDGFMMPQEDCHWDTSHQ